MLFATDKFTLSFGDTAKLTIQYENNTLTNTGKKQAIVEASKDGYTWAQVASIAPESSLPLKIEALYVRLTTDTTISVVNTNPIPRDTKKSDIAVNINTEALVIKDDLQAYVSKNELNNLVHRPDLSGFVTKAQVQQMIPEIPTPHDITGLASKESVESKADQTDVDDLKLTVATKADTEHNHTMNDVTGLQEALNGKSPTNHTHTWGSITGKPTTFNPTTHGHGISDITGLQAQLDSKLAKQEAETTYAKKTELPQPVDLSGYATKQSVDNLSQAVNALSGTGDVDLSGLATKEELATKANATHSHAVADINGLQAALNGKAPTSHSHSWNSITGKPTTFASSSHTHAWSQITNVPTSSTSTAGIVQLNDTLVSTATDQALTAKQGKALDDNKLDKTANAVSASRLATARTISLTGEVTGSVSFDGSKNVGIATTLNLAGFANSKTENGYQKLPNGLIIQWGEYILTSYHKQPSTSIVFPIAFPYKCLHVFTTGHMARHSEHGDGDALVISKSTTGAELSVQSLSYIYTGLRGFSWLAIGY